MPPQPAIAGSRTFVGPSAGGEGPWYRRQGANPTLNIPDCAVGDTIMVWMDAQLTPPVLTNADLTQGVAIPYGAGGPGALWMFIATCTTAGTVSMSADLPCIYVGWYAHKTSSPFILAT